MQIQSIRTLEGPNVYSYKPVLVMELDLEELAGRETRELKGFNDRLVKLLPGLHEHVCGLGTPGGLIERLEGGTYFGHVIEHVALELSEPAGVPVRFGKTRVTDNPRVYKVIVAYTSAPVMRLLLQTAVDLVDQLARGEEFFELGNRIAEARAILSRTSLGPSTAAIVNAARSRGIPTRRLNDESLVQLGYGKHRRLVQATVASTTSSVAVEIASDKELTRQILAGAFVPTPAGGVAYTEEDAVRLFKEIGGRVAVKPLNGNQGRGVSLEVCDERQVITAFRQACTVSRAAVVEQMLQGRDYRVLVVGGRFVAASERVPAGVTGDGVSTIEQLVDEVNRDPCRGDSHELPLTRIRLDDCERELLEAQGLRRTDVPPAATRVQLRRTANLSTGGTARDVSDKVHPEVRSTCERAARMIGLDICGLDLILEDISRPLPEKGGGVVEVNAGPGVRMHHHPSEGEPRDVGAAIVDMLFPHGEQGRVPIVAITGTNGKTTVARMLAHAFAKAGVTAGLTTTDGVYVNGEAVVCGDMTGPRSARAVLADPAVEVAVLETARGGIVRAGLGYDWSDVAVVTNIQADHIGQDGIRTVDDLVHIKSLVPERVREGGTIVLNADDVRAAGLAQADRIRRIPRNIVLFSLQPRNREVEQHVRAGGTAYFPRRGWIVEARGTVVQPVCRIASVACTLGGAAQFNLSNALAAVAAGRAMQLDCAVLAAALESFAPERENPGRANLYEIGHGYLMLDYGHNPAAMAAVARMLSNWRGRRLTGILGLPGDRLDQVACDAVAAAAEAFDRIIIREDHDLRGRKAGEMAGLILRELSRLRPECPCTVVAEEHQALRTAIQTMEPSELVVMFYDDYEGVRAIVHEFGARPALHGMRELHVRGAAGKMGARDRAADRRYTRRIPVGRRQGEQAV
jgi:cyanophycin synthetase